MRIHTGLMALTLTAISACGKGADAPRTDDAAANDAAATDAAVPGGGALEEFTLACMAHSNLERPICECTGKKADAALSDDGLAFLTAMLQKDTERADDLRQRMPAPEIVTAGTFMASGPAQCAAERAGSGQ